MKTKRKWIWTIVVLLIVVVLGAAAFAVGSRFGYRGGFERFGMMERGYNRMQPFNRPLLGYRAPMGGLFRVLGMALMCLLPLGILALAVVGGVSLIRGSRSRKSANAVAPAAPAASVELSTPAVEPAEVVSSSVERECASCGKPAQADWKTCPYCGTPLA
jgi:hypothetical protein